MRVNEAMWLLGLCVDGCRCKKKEDGRESGCGQEFVVGGVIGDSGALWGSLLFCRENRRPCQDHPTAATLPLMMPRPAKITTASLHRTRRSDLAKPFWAATIIIR